MDSLEAVHCPLCGAVDEEKMYVKDGFNVVRCRQCALVYINPRLSPEALERLYNRNEISPQHYYEEHISQDIKHFGKRLEIIERFKKGGTLLDIGTNIGTMLKVAKDKGWQVRGVEFNHKAVEFGNEHFGVNIEDRDFTKTKYDPESFDVVTMNDVIEHVIDPIATLKEIRTILKKDCILFMTTPNIGAFMARISGRHWLHLKPNEHLTYFTPSTMAALLEKSGFNMVHVQSVGHVRTLDTVLKKGRAYSRIPYVLGKLLPQKVKDGVSLYINSGDEMVVVAAKK
jgi:2-polyprenyl-3-methyl-5-hydroxy-6-metoxy-1,4-benzoquinol methylase